MIAAIQDEINRRGLGNHTVKNLVCVMSNSYIGGNKFMFRRALKAFLAKKIISWTRGCIIRFDSFNRNLRFLGS